MILVFTRNEEQVATLDWDLVDPTETEDLQGEMSLEIKYPANGSDADTLIEGHFLAMRDMDNHWQFYEIVRAEAGAGSDAEMLTVYAEHVYYELGTEPVKTLEFLSVNPTVAITQILQGTRWQVGTVELGNLRTQTMTDFNPLSALWRITEIWGGELRFRVELSGTGITGRYVDLLQRRGEMTGLRFEFGHNLRNISIQTDTTELVTALHGRGMGEEITGDGEPVRIDFRDIVWSVANGDPVDKPLGQDWVGCPIARELYGKPGPSGRRHIFGLYESQAKSGKTLLEETWRQVVKQSAPNVNIQSTVADLEQLSIDFAHMRARLGDSTYVKVPQLQAQLEARIFRIVRRRKKPGETLIEQGSYRPAGSNLLNELEMVRRQLLARQAVWDKARAFNPDGTLNGSWVRGELEAIAKYIVTGGGHVVAHPDSGFWILNTTDLDTATGAIRGIASGGKAVFAIMTRPTVGAPWQVINAMTQDGIVGEAITAGVIVGERLMITSGTTFAEGYDPSTKETPAGAQAKADTAQINASMLASALAALLANGQYTGGTFIDGNSVVSPVIAGLAGAIAGILQVGNNSLLLDGPGRNIRAVDEQGNVKARLGQIWVPDETGTPISFVRNSIAFDSQGREFGVNQPVFDGGLRVTEGTTNQYAENIARGQQWTSFGGATLTVTPGQNDPGRGNGGVRVQSAGGTSVLKAFVVAGTPAVGIQWTGQIWVRNRADNNLTLLSNQGNQSAAIPPDGKWYKVVWVVTGTAGGTTAQHQLRTATAAQNVDCDVAFLQYEVKPYPTPWTIGTRAAEQANLPIVTSANMGLGVTIRPDWSNNGAGTSLFRRALDGRINANNSLALLWLPTSSVWYAELRILGASFAAVLPVFTFLPGEEIKFYLWREGGAYNLRAAHNGTTYTATPVSAGNMPAFSSLSVGHQSGGNQLNGAISDLVILPNATEADALKYLAGEVG